MKTVFIYNASWHTFGGGEKYVCAVADALSRNPDFAITLLIDRPSITKNSLREYFNLTMDNVEVRTVEPRTIESLLSNADISVVVSNFRPYGCRARKNVYILQIPYPVITLREITASLLRFDWKEAGKNLLRRKLLSHARAADLVLVYSGFVKDVLCRNHDINAQVLHPPIDDFANAIPKENMILSVGRFFSGLYNDKRYDVLVEAFKKLQVALPHSSWTYHLVGSCPPDSASRHYVEQLRDAAAGHPIYLHVNSPYEELRHWYNQASLFWHAAGFGVDEMQYPERTEHFGMSTVEAMSAGCVPVVANAGGQKEIVSHGKSGYLWNTVDELVRHTADLITNPELRTTIGHHARERFLDFDRKHFSNRLISLFEQLDTN